MYEESKEKNIQQITNYTAHIEFHIARNSTYRKIGAFSYKQLEDK